jgi:hypothetical protein
MTAPCRSDAPAEFFEVCQVKVIAELRKRAENTNVWD